ncbi:MAG TPA: alpha/beta hydrolase [Herpetosiphonaceae bacterium]|nr:alpha/beta hydrolase [Herpetosiphonaceae bacterium]
MPMYAVNQQSIHVWEEGDADKPVALLIHGWSSSWFALSPLLPILKTRHRCMAVDLPGYGQSPRGQARVSIDAYADMLAELLRQVTDQPAVIIGHSMGGMIALTMALRHPGLAERLVLLCPTISGRLSLFINLFISPLVVLERIPFADRLTGLIEQRIWRITDRVMKPASYADRSSISDEAHERIKADVRRPGQGRIRAECYRAMREHDLRGQLGQVSIPSLYIWGMEDNTVPLRDASAVIHANPDADLRIIPNAGHWPQFEALDITQRYVRAFLSTPMKLLKVQF